MRRQFSLATFFLIVRHVSEKKWPHLASTFFFFVDLHFDSLDVQSWEMEAVRGLRLYEVGELNSPCLGTSWHNPFDLVA